MNLLEKTFLVLEILHKEGPSMTLRELTGLTGLPKPSVYRIVQALCGIGYLRHGEGSGQYELTGRMRELVAGDPEIQLKQAANPLMQDLHAAFGETVNLGLRERGSIRYVEVLETSKPLRWIVTPGARDSLFTTALGKSILSRFEEQALEKLIESQAGKSQLDRRSGRKLVGEIRMVREQGWAKDVEATSEGVVCVGFSMADWGYPRAAISIAVPSIRYDAKLERQIVGRFRKLRISRDVA